ncbi:hypothetical protein Ciccas_005014 [Cichlidogyrus casuarinus]|uniref:Calponin-homology (CH) domain-containing protein n=1 Tax=Cichlidogyrus casuarinus TaxID=1844966 RepID=A0ABD2QDE0_9PLAT
MANYTADLQDSEIYAALLQQVAPEEHRALMIPASGILAESDMYKRAEMVIENADFLGAGAFIAAEDIALASEKGMNRDKLHLAFLANLFNLYPGFESGPIVEIDETLEEKTYRNWMNSMGVAPFVKDMSADLRSGLIFLQLIDVLSPGVVDWTKIVRCFNPKRRLFQMQDNCAYAIEYASQLNLKLVNQSGEDIRTGDRKLTLGLTFQLMKLYTLQMLTKLRGNGWPVDDNEILAWANERLMFIGAAPLCSFRDMSIETGVPILNLINAIKPNSVDKCMVSKDKDANCRLAISIARKIGARVYALPEHLREVNPKMVMTVFACLMALDYQINASSA